MAQPKTRPKPAQLEMVYKTRPVRGGARKGAGRKATYPRPQPHRARPALASRFPVHVTLRVDDSLPDLRGGEVYREIEACLRSGKQRDDFRLVHYSMLTHHLHLVAEATNAKALTNGIRGLSVRIARRLNRLVGRRGRVFSDRYFSRILRTPRETQAAIRYVLLNVRRHALQHGRQLMDGWLDDCSSGRFFDGWSQPPPRPPPEDLPSVAKPVTWLLASGWRRWGLLHINDVPRAVSAAASVRGRS